MRCSLSHEWIREEGHYTATVGITDYAQGELGDIVYIELPEIGKRVQAKEEVAVIESTKAAADIYSPVSGDIIAVNEQLRRHPEWINQSPQDRGWIYQIRLSHPQELETLMEMSAYLQLVIPLS